MNNEAIHQLGEKIGTVMEVETDEAGDCIGQYARVRISIDISQPLKKLVFLQQEEATIPMPILYEKLPDFCFCCAHIGHQYRDCLSYKGQPKEDLPYGGWMRVVTQAERLKHTRSRETSHRDHFNTHGNVQSTTRTKAHNPVTRDGSALHQTSRATTGASLEDARNTLLTDNVHLMLSPPETQNKQVGSQSMGCVDDEVQPRA